MAKKDKAKEEVHCLKYNGDGSQFIVGIPARDLGHIDLIALADERDCEIEDVVALLTDGAAGRTTREGKPLYEVGDAWPCGLCGETFQSWDAYHAHDLEAHVRIEEPEIEGVTESTEDGDK